MRHHFVRVALALLSVPVAASAGVTLDVQVAPSVEAGQPTSVLVSASSDSNERVLTFTLPMLFENAAASGYSLSPVAPIVPAAGFTANFNASPAIFPPPYDGLVNGEAVDDAGFELDGTLKPLFTINLVTNLGTSPGVFDVTIVRPTTPDHFEFNAPGVPAPALSILGINQGSFEVTAVPEPGAVWMLCVVGVGICAKRWWARK